MKCPECGIDFKGNQFWRDDVVRAMRECLNGHEFIEPPKPRSKTKHEKIVDAVVARCDNVLRLKNNMHPQYVKAHIDILSIINQ